MARRFRRPIFGSIFSSILSLLTLAGLLVCILFGCIWLAAPIAHADDFGKRQVDLELEEVPGATSYEVELTSKATSKTLTFKMKTPHWKATIRPGEYTLRLRSYDERNVPGDWSESTPFTIKLAGPDLISPVLNAEIKTAAAEKFDVEFKWQAIPGTSKYRVDVTPLDPTGGARAVVSETFKTNEGKLALPVAGKFTWKVTPISNTGVEGESQEMPGAFTLIGAELNAPEIERPEDKYVQSVKWAAPKYAEKYNFILTRRKNAKEWERIDAKKDFVGTEEPFSLKYPGGHYRFTVQASGSLRENSKPAHIEFDVYTGDRTPAAIEEAKLRESLDKPTPWYFVASYMVSAIQYNGTDAESGHGLSYGSIGGIGRLGLGYINPDSNRGYLGLVDLAGATINGKTVTWASAEAHYIWRYNWGRNMIRPSVGVYYKEMPETQNTETDATAYTQDIVAVAGPHAGFDFWRPFTSKLGLQINARIYYDALKISTPNNGALEGQPSYQLGVMGSYKIKNNIMGFMGWAHREDNATYKATPGNGSNGSVANPGAEQVLKIDGDYFNMLMEWSF